MSRYLNRARLAVTAATAVLAIGVLPAPATAAPPITGSMEFTGEATVQRAGNQCRFTARLEANVSTTTTGNPEGFTGNVEATWRDACPSASTVAVSGTADIRLTGVQTSMSGTPEGFRANGKGSNVSTSMGGNPEGFKFRGTFTNNG